MYVSFNAAQNCMLLVTLRNMHCKPIYHTGINKFTVYICIAQQLSFSQYWNSVQYNPRPDKVMFLMLNKNVVISYHAKSYQKKSNHKIIVLSQGSVNCLIRLRTPMLHTAKCIDEQHLQHIRNQQKFSRDSKIRGNTIIQMSHRLEFPVSNCTSHGPSTRRSVAASPQAVHPTTGRSSYTLPPATWEWFEVRPSPLRPRDPNW